MPDLKRNRILEHMHSVEPLLRRTASLEVDTSASIEHVIDTILTLVPADAGTGEMGGTSARTPGTTIRTGSVSRL